MKRLLTVFFLSVALVGCVRPKTPDRGPEAKRLQGVAPALVQTPPKLGFIKNTEMIEGCSCVFHPRNEQVNTKRVYFFSKFGSVDGSKNASYVNYLGKDVRSETALNPSDPSGRFAGPLRQRFQMGKLKVEIDAWRETTLDEVSSYHGFLNVDDGTSAQQIPVTGQCGC